ncbi:MAG TPA: Clp protease N-terminal domain-containing protein, partial [Chloroflexota bacterium]
PRALGAVRLAAEHASSAGRPVDTRDLLIGLIDEGEGVAAGALGAVGLDLAGLRERLAGTG